MSLQSQHGVELACPPSDGVSALRFAEHAELLLVASWDAHVRLYDVALNSLRVAFRQRAPVLDAAFLARGGSFAPRPRRARAAALCSNPQTTHDGRPRVTRRRARARRTRTRR